MADTAIAEPPAPAAETEPKVEIPPASTPMGSLLAGLRVIRENGAIEVSKVEDKKPEEPKKEEPKALDKPQEKQLETKKPDTEPEHKDAKELGLSEKASQKFRKLEASRDEAVKERDKLNSELQELRGKVEQFEKSTPQNNPEEIKQYVSQIQQRDETISQLRSELRAASIERDPDFVDRFVKSKEKRISDIKQLAMAAGASEADFNRALKYGDEDQLTEWRNSLKPAQQRNWDARMLEIDQIEYQRQEALENSQKSWQELQTKREQQWTQQQQEAVKQNMKLADNVVDSVFKEVEFLQEDTELKTTVSKTLKAIAGGEGAEQWTPDMIMKGVAWAHVQNKILGIQKSVIDGHEAKIAELEKQAEELTKKTTEQEEFIRKISGGMPRTDSSSSNGAGGESKSLLSQVRVVLPGGR